ncbi:FAD-dependent monooxygenase [Hamadaea sp. NPDC051192]|uniref:FAD-dependent monooxygenase n=1 Tax=Hamadaea sp. NPDC051192 TaxID=3154940 RepID=UPI0034476E91
MPDLDPRPGSTPDDRLPSVAIVGGSLTGTVAALMLTSAGFPVTVYEAAPAAASPAGGLLSLEHPALELLDRLGVDQSEYLTGPAQHIEQITVIDRRPTATVRRAYPGRFTTWTLLHAALSRRLPDPIVHRGVRITGLARHGDQPVLATAGGPTPPADLILFADGRTSTGRQLLDPGRRLRYAGYVAHRGTTPRILPPGDFQRFEPGPGAQFNIAPVPGGADWTFYLPATADAFATLFGDRPDRRAFVLPHQVSAAARVHVDEHATRLLPAAQAGLVDVTAHRTAVPMMDIDPPTRMVWPVGGGHAILLGDALAPVRPHTARGANNGIEQAAGLATALTQHAYRGADLAGALNGWQRRHLPTVAQHLRLGTQIADKLGLAQPVTDPAPGAPATRAHAAVGAGSRR